MFRQPATAAAIAFLFALLSALGITSLGDTDPYRHLVYAHELWRTGGALRGHPFLPLTILGDSGVDLWWTFHWALVPFTALGTLWGARMAGATIAAIVAASLTTILRKLNARAAWAFALTPLAISATFAFRDHLARPSHLTIPLVLINLAVGAGAITPLWAAIASLLHATFHLSAPLSPIFALIGFVGASLARSRPPPRALLWSIGGLTLGLLVRPDRGNYLAIAAHTVVEALGGAAVGRLPHVAPELQPMHFVSLLTETGAGFLLVLLATTLAWRRARSGTNAMLVAALLATVATTVGCFLSMRFADYLVPLLAMDAALLWPRDHSLALRLSRTLTATLAASALLLGAHNVRAAWALGNRYIDPPATFEKMAAIVRKSVPAGSMLFTDDPFLTGVLYASLPEYRYIVAYDPAVLYAGRPHLFWRWHHAVVDGALCDEQRCENAPVGPEAIASAVRSFDTEWIVTSYPRDRFSMQSVMLAAPQLFELRGVAEGPVTGLYLWHVLALRNPAQIEE